MSIVLEMQDVCKTFYGEGVELKANDHVNFELRKGEIHALLGENGAGKSTLVNTLFHKPDSGLVKLNGKKVQLNNPITALKFGLGIARQDLTKSLIERHTIAENILSVSEGFFLSLKSIAEKIKKVIVEYDLGNLNPDTKVGKLSGGEKQRVEILKALITNPNIVILDEPTAMLTPIEIESFFKLLNNLRDEGKSIVIITHHLEEAIRFSDRITILRQGKVVETIDTHQAKEVWKSEEDGINNLANLMVGRDILYDLSLNPLPAGNIVMKVTDFHVRNDMDDLVVNGVSLQLKESQILGLAGIAGNGQTELVEAILHLRKLDSGNLIIREKNMDRSSIKEIRNSGVAYIPEDRRKALVLDLSVRENLMLNTYQESSNFLIDVASTVSKTDDLIKKYNVKTASPMAPIRTLSGGNKQKVVVARELSLSPPEGGLILIAENPTFGLDVGTTQFVREEILNMRSKGAAVLLVSNDLTEILTLSDEIAVLHKGKIMGIVKGEEANRRNIGLLMGGVNVNSGGS
ncbi:MAG: ABC transporter ATP-binding protein [Candidatus Hodarchaeales archaeon]|jgi:simple sugar transport system ATP-binding protein